MNLTEEQVISKFNSRSGIKDSLLDKFSDYVLDNISTKEVYNKTQGGEGVKNQILQINDDVYRGVNEQYSHSRQLNKGIEGNHAELAHDLLDRIIEMKKIPARVAVSNQIISKSKDILNRLVTLDPKGNITGYKSISNQELIDQVQELRQIIDYDFLVRPLIKDIESSVERTASEQGAEAAVESWKETTKSYRNWSDLFNNDQINPYRNRSNTDYEALYNKALNKDTFRALEPILDQSEGGKLLSKVIQRDIAQQELSPFLENPRNINTQKFDTSLRELEAVISPEIIANVRKAFQEYSGKFKTDRAIAKIKNLSPEEIAKKMDSVSGIQELRDSLSKNPTQRKLFEDMKNEKLLDMFREGELEKTVTGTDLYNVVNKTKNYEILKELLGKEEVEELRLAARELAEKEEIKEEEENQNNFKKIKRKWKQFWSEEGAPQ